jgi:hypothetical protein
MLLGNGWQVGGFGETDAAHGRAVIATLGSPLNAATWGRGFDAVGALNAAKYQCIRAEVLGDFSLYDRLRCLRTTT